MSTQHQSALDLEPVERRQTQRHDVQLAAKAGIRYGVPEPCTILNVSPMGALLEFKSPQRVPKQFRITVDSKLFSADCEVRHQSGARVGVMFISNRLEALAAFG